MSTPRRDSGASHKQGVGAAQATSSSTTKSSEIGADAIDASHAADKVDDNSKLRTFLGILRRFVGVSDIAAVRFSLPAHLLEPTPNLEYWHYLDRPDAFVAIGQSKDDLGRMLEVLRFWFTKDLKYVKGKPCKPYNSALGEFFRANWEVKNTLAPVYIDHPSRGKESTDSSIVNQPVLLSYLTEQTSHHPPISAFYMECPDRGIVAKGFDQLSAKFTGTSIKVGPGSHNLGIFITLKKQHDEEYQLTHPIAHLGGFLRGTLAITVSDTCYVTCPKTKTKTILEYLEEGWLGKTQNRMRGVIYRYDPEHDTRRRIKEVPEKDILAKVEGCWHEQITYTLTGAKESVPLIDLRPLIPLQKSVPPLTHQLPNESQRFWAAVTTSIKEKKFAEATKYKQELEEAQRERARQREKSGQAWRAKYFEEATRTDGRPELSQAGRIALDRQNKGNWTLEQIEEN